MKVIVGLGNPGKKYEKTRHNVGFMVIDQLIKEYNLKSKQTKFKAEYYEFFHHQEKIILLKPQTYMNLSGESLAPLVQFYDLDLEDILVITDDLNLEIGKIRIRKKGSSGGQNGLKNIIHHLKTENFPRLRIGIGKDHKIDTVDYVLGKLDQEVALDQAFLAATEFIQGNSIDMIMNRYN